MVVLAAVVVLAAAVDVVGAAVAVVGAAVDVAAAVVVEGAAMIVVPWSRKWQSTPVFLPGESCGQSSLGGYSQWGHKRVGRDWASQQQRKTKWCMNKTGIARGKFIHELSISDHSLE